MAILKKLMVLCMLGKTQVITISWLDCWMFNEPRPSILLKFSINWRYNCSKCWKIFLYHSSAQKNSDQKFVSLIKIYTTLITWKFSVMNGSAGELQETKDDLVKPWVNVNENINRAVVIEWRMVHFQLPHLSRYGSPRSMECTSSDWRDFRNNFLHS